MIKLFFVTDIHGSNVCYRKFLNALPIYEADIAVLLGDLTGKVLVPLVERSASSWECTLMGQHVDIETGEQLGKIKKTIESAGYYWTHLTRDEFEATRSDPAKIDALFKRLVLERVQEWLDLADERLAGKPFQMFMSPGNDDWPVIDEMIDAAKLVHPCDGRNVDLDGHEMITCSWSNPTPWQTPRELPEEELEAKLEELCRTVKNNETAIYNFHVPPYGYSLDLCPKLSKDLTMSAEEKIHAGSLGAKHMVEKYQPLLGLFGHIHESRGAQKAGRTLLINPGSEYSEGILKGVVIMLDKKKIKDYVFTSG
jgi:Icc-related predicted phosphoesterase